ncbi:Alpha/beta hydrolase [Ceraceosorus bombacis]|uniref:Alpha/beta hydrolase n=1 Tax=Ceraceosorus bombacis TaxID=401625 RepID=A0A0P1BCU4_9BASI|nr:Alpha/beta hydrolase [Ceraceosorus bombacis]
MGLWDYGSRLVSGLSGAGAGAKTGTGQSQSGKGLIAEANPMLGHAQTIYSVLAPTQKPDYDPVRYKRYVLLTTDGGTISVDVAEPELQDAWRDDAGVEHEHADGHSKTKTDENRPTVVIAHGLTGGSHESYVRHLISHLVTPSPQRPASKLYRCAVINFRGCANTPVTSRQLYSAMKTADYASGLSWIRNQWPDSVCVGVGFSLGANVVSRYLGEWGDQAQLWGAAVLAAPFDTLAGSHSLESGLLGPIYSKAMCNNLSALARAHKDTLSLDKSLRPALRHLLGPPTDQTDQLDRERHQKRGTLKWVDDTVTRLVGGHQQPFGLFPFESSHAYYSNAGALSVLKHVARPLLVLNADDDPIVAPESVKGVRQVIGLDAEQDVHQDGSARERGNANIILCTTRGGGHLGWWQGNRNPTRWLAKPVGEFVDAMVKGAQDVLASADDALEHSAGPAQKRRTKQVAIEAELLGCELLPAWDVQAESETEEEDARGTESGDKFKRGTQNADNTTTSAKAAALAPVKGGRHAWLLSPVLPLPKGDAIAHDQLLHPSMSSRYSGPAKGQGEILKSFMTVDEEKVEIGYCLLPDHSNVAGAGSIFRGGVDTPGSKESGGAASGSGTIRGL